MLEAATGGASSMSESAADAAGGVGEEGVIEKFMLFCRVSAPWYVMGSLSRVHLIREP